jgi:cysteine desulfurase
MRPSSAEAPPAKSTTAVGQTALYLDHHATTPVDARVLEAMLPYFGEDFGNAASATHVYGWRAEGAVEDARERIAACLGAEPREIVFTSGATESNNLAILGAAEASGEQRRHLITVASEHPAVLDPCRHLADRGFEVTVLPVDAEGLLDPGELDRVLRRDTLLVSVMAANNEIGVLQPIEEVGRLCRERGALFHTDAAQAVGRIPLDVDAIPLDLLSLSGHKIYGPKGVGALFVRSRPPRARLVARQHGGGHERGLRSGTLPVPLIVGMALALEICLEEQASEAQRLSALRERLWKALARSLPGTRLNGHQARRLPGNLNVSFEGVDGERLLLALPDIAVSSGSACASVGTNPSHVLSAIGLSPRLARASLRFGLGRSTTEEQVDRAAARVVEEVQRQRAR